MYTRRETETSAQCKLRGDTRIEIEQTGRIDDATERRTGREEKHEIDGKEEVGSGLEGIASDASDYRQPDCIKNATRKAVDMVF